MTSPIITAASMFGRWRDDVLNGSPPVRYPLGTGFDSIMIGPGRIVVVGGPPGTSKTALAMQWITDAMRLTPSAEALVVCVEMAPAALLERILARLSGIPLELIAGRQLDDAQHGERLARGFATMAEIAPRLHFLQPPFAWTNIVAGLEATKPQILLLDYLQRIGPPGESESARLAVSASMECARRAADADLAVLLLSAVGRVGDDGKKYRGLGLGSFRESSEIEYGADDAFVLVRDDSDDESSLTLKHVKSRHGRPTDIPLLFRGDVMSFTATAAPAHVDLTVAIRDAWQSNGKAGGHG